MLYICKTTNDQNVFLSFTFGGRYPRKSAISYSQNNELVQPNSIFYNCNCSDSYSRDRRYHIQPLSTSSLLLTFFMDFTSIKSIVLIYSRKDNYLYVSGTMEDDKNYPSLRLDTVKFEERVVVSV